MAEVHWVNIPKVQNSFLKWDFKKKDADCVRPVHCQQSQVAFPGHAQLSTMFRLAALTKKLLLHNRNPFSRESTWCRTVKLYRICNRKKWPFSFTFWALFLYNQPLSASQLKFFKSRRRARTVGQDLSWLWKRWSLVVIFLPSLQTSLPSCRASPAWAVPTTV